MKESEVKYTKFNLWVWKHLPECRDIVKIITARMDSKISWRDRILLKVHLLACDPCTNFLKQIKFIRTVLLQSDEKLDETMSSLKLSDDARGRLKEALKGTNPATESET